MSRIVLPRLGLLLAVLLPLHAFAQDDLIDHAEAFDEGQKLAQVRAYEEAYTQFAQALELAEEAEDPLYVARARSVLAQLDYIRGTQALRAEEPEAALEHFDTGIAHRPRYARNYFGKARALRSMSQFEPALEVLLSALEIEDEEGARRVTEQIREHFLAHAAYILTRTGEEPTRADAREALAILARSGEYAAPDDEVRHQEWLIRRFYR